MDNSCEMIKENSELRLMARQRLQGNWMTPVIVSFCTYIAG